MTDYFAHSENSAGIKHDLVARDFFAHSANDHNRWHLLRTHLTSVGKIAREIAGKAVWKDEVQLAGLLHDLGKYADRFQARLRGEDSGLDHWSQGAWLALTKYRAVAAALAIEGHHVGLQPGSKDALRRLIPENLARHHPFRLSLSDADLPLLEARAKADGLDFPEPGVFAL